METLVYLLGTSGRCQIRGNHHPHWSLLWVKNAWSIDRPSPSTASSKVLTISTSLPFCVPRRAPRTVTQIVSGRGYGDRRGIPPNGLFVLVRSFIRVRCSDMLRIGKGWLAKSEHEIILRVTNTLTEKEISQTWLWTARPRSVHQYPSRSSCPS